MRSGGARTPVVGVLVAMLAVVLVAGCGAGSDKPGPSSGSGVTIPADLPTGDIPLIDGTVLAAGGSKANGWNLTIQARSGSKDALDAAVGTLTAAGYTESSRSGTSGARVVLLDGTKKGTHYFVQVGAAPTATGGANSVYYEISTGS
ncbi:hypothetical protein [Williamsia sterculiae]|uniref:Lipoprotein n=1 Tax=Williamsia sterculiae TaxID=1344003 RepID=A0A1N7F0I7_9NOCA|nr:hypothetical protein [Williamsia sterculiae]SIR93705.1 hypothetical protein SAMN05445060_1686 [Williamsia sterculiae]